MCVFVWGWQKIQKNRCKYFDKRDLEGKANTKFKAPTLTLAGCYQKCKYFDKQDSLDRRQSKGKNYVGMVL